MPAAHVALGARQGLSADNQPSTTSFVHCPRPAPHPTLRSGLTAVGRKACGAWQLTRYAAQHPGRASARHTAMGSGSSRIALPGRESALCRRLCFQGRPALPLPDGNRRLVALRGARAGALDALPQRVQQPTDVGGMGGDVVSDAKGTADDLGDSHADPDLAAELVHLRPALQQGGDLRPLRGVQPGGGTRRRMTPP